MRAKRPLLPHNAISIQPKSNNELQKPTDEEIKYMHKQVRRTRQYRGQTVMEYGIISWGASVESKRIFQQQKIIIRIMTGSTSRTVCRTLFRNLGILTLTSQYILSSMRFFSSNLETYTFNTSVHNINTRLKLKLHKPAARLSMYQRCTYYNSINIYNKLPDDLDKIVSNKKRILLQLKKYLANISFYSLEEYLIAL
jgi:hypothetical protein